MGAVFLFFYNFMTPYREIFWGDSVVKSN